MKKAASTLVLVLATGSHAYLYAQSWPYGDGPATIPGLIYAVSYDGGGEGVGFHDPLTPYENLGGACRPDEGVDTAWGGSGCIVGWVAAPPIAPDGEWLNYTVNVTTTGTYTAAFRVASLGQGGTFHVELDGYNVSGPISIPDTGGWDQWTTVSQSLNLWAGDWQVLRLVMESNGDIAVGNFESIRFTMDGGVGGGGALRVLTWNIDFGCSDGDWGCFNYTLPDQVQFIADSGVQVAVLQEVLDDSQPELYRSLLQTLTGRTWYKVYAPAPWSGIGELILSTYPVIDSTTTYIGPSDAGRALIDVNGVQVNIVADHLEPYDYGLRWSELLGVMDFARQFDGPKLIIGDHNSWWCECRDQSGNVTQDGPWCYIGGAGHWGQMTSEYSDTWYDLNGTEDGGYTIGNVRFDYIFRSYDSSWRLTPLWAYVGPTWLSDHAPVIAEYQVQ